MRLPLSWCPPLRKTDWGRKASKYFLEEFGEKYPAVLPEERVYVELTKARMKHLAWQLHLVPILHSPKCKDKKPLFFQDIADSSCQEGLDWLFTGTLAFLINSFTNGRELILCQLSRLFFLMLSFNQFFLIKKKSNINYQGLKQVSQSNKCEFVTSNPFFFEEHKHWIKDLPQTFN